MESRDMHASALAVMAELSGFSKVNRARAERWHPRGIASWSLSDWAVALMGEVGEVCDVVVETAWWPAEKEKLAHEIADVYTYLDLCACRSLTETLHECWKQAADAFRSRSEERLSPVDVTWEAVALAASAGSLCDTIKKLNRERDGITGNNATVPELWKKVTWQMGLTAFALHRLATAAEIDLAAAVIDKFNRVSERAGFPERV